MENLQIALNLPLQYVQIVLASLGKQPYETVSKTVTMIEAQAQAQIDAAQAPKAPPAEPPQA